MDIRPQIAFLGDYFDGGFHQGPSDGEWTNKSPANHSEIVAKVSYSYQHIDQACDCAQKAFVGWSALSLQELSLIHI